MSLRAEAESLLIQAQQAKGRKEYETALRLFQESLPIWIDLYKVQPEGTSEKLVMLEILETSMSQAEEVKELIERAKNAPPPAPTPASAAQHPPSSSGGFSVFSWFGSGSSSTKPAAAPTPPPQAVPDFHDYTEVIRSTPKPAAPAANAPSTGGATSSSSAAAPRNKGVNGAAAKAKVNSAIASAQGKPRPFNASANTTGAAGAARRTPSPSMAGVTKQTSASGKQLKVPVDSAPATMNEYEKQILDEMLDTSPGVVWEDIAGLSFAKQTLQEAVILPNLRPDLFTGLRSPPKGVLLFGPPGTGKTLLAKAVATESGFCFFSITSSSVTSKYLGEGEKLMKALFEISRQKQPSVIFFDEIDALMSARKENEHEASRRLKTEFMTQVDGAATTSTDRILVMAATNIPWEIDEAVLRRLAKRIYVPLPDAESRRALVSHLLSKHMKHGSSSSNSSGEPVKKALLDRIVSLTEGYSGSDLSAVCHEAALGPIRELGTAALRTIKAEEVRPINEQDFVNAVRNIRPSVSGDTLQAFVKWSQQYGVSR